MAHTLSAKKRARQGVKRSLRNQTAKSRIKTQLKKAHLLLPLHKEAPDTKLDKEALVNETKKSVKLIDKAVSKGIIHKNKAARLKSRLMLSANKFLK